MVFQRMVFILASIGHSVLWTNNDLGGQIYFTDGETYETTQLFEGEAQKRVYDYVVMDEVLYFAVVGYDSR